MMDLKTLISKTAIHAELTRVRNSMRREDRETTPEGYRAVFDKFSIRWRLILSPYHPDSFQKTTTGNLAFRSLRHQQNDVRSKNILVAGHETRNRKRDQGLHRIPLNTNNGKNITENWKNFPNPVEKYKSISLKSYITKIYSWKYKIILAGDRFSNWPTMKICKTSVFIFLTSNFNLYAIPEKIKSDKGGASISTKFQQFCKNRNIEIE